MPELQTDAKAVVTTGRSPVGVIHEPAWSLISRKPHPFALYFELATR